MVQMSNKDFWKNGKNLCCKGVSNERIKFVENKIGIQFPNLYVKLMKECDGGRVVKNSYEYFDKYKNEKRITLY